MLVNEPQTTQVRATRPSFIDMVTFTALETEDKLKYFCLLGHLAPSSHNTQPWRFFIDKETFGITVYLNREFVLPASDVEGRQAIVSLGCAIENIIIGARYYGYAANTKFLTNDKIKIKPLLEGEQKFTGILKIELEQSEPKTEYEHLARAIFDRKVVRAEYDPTRQIPNNVLETIKKIPDGEITQLHLITGSIHRLTIAEFQAQADGYVINSPKFSRELGDWLLPNNSSSDLGMLGADFGLQDDEALRMHNGLSGKSSLQPEDGLKFAMGGKIFIEKSPLIGIISTKKDDLENWIMAGRIFENIFLELTCQGIQVAVHAGITEVSLVKKIFAMTMGTTRHITVLFRAGYVKKEEDAKRPHSPRLPLEEIIFTDKP